MQVLDSLKVDDIETFRWAYDLARKSDGDYLDKQQSVSAVDEPTFLREFAWVVLSAGFKEAVLRRRFAAISLCFLDWSSGQEIAAKRRICVATALDVFSHRKKMEAIASGAELVAAKGFERLKQELRRDFLTTLLAFPYIGPATVYHLAKNLGIDVAKPDRHLIRISAQHGYPDVQQFCQAVSELTGCPVHTVDTVLWRLAERGYSQRLLLRSLVKKHP